jgi:hypothetical protein
MYGAVPLSARKLLSLAFICFNLMKDFVNHVRDRCGGVDYNPVFGNAFFRLIQASNDFPFLWSTCLPPQSVGFSATRSSIRRRQRFPGRPQEQTRCRRDQ